ncbi:MAG: DUF2905 domain-containing protein [Burkholderiales bacterium]|nr:DUF2905 domain-containing protein [Burkholderiales bacterium]
MSRWLIASGLLLLLLGLAWPWLTKLGLGSLPGDIQLERKGFRFYFPLTSSVIVSLLISFVVWLFRR